MRNHLKNLWVHLTSLLGTMSARLVVLLVASAIGVALVKCVSPWVLCFFPVSVYGDIRTVIGAAPFTLPVFLALWWFRTYDSFQADWRAKFNEGIAHVVSEMPARIEIGAVMLISISEATSSYDREISAAFIRRLNQSPTETEENRNLLNKSNGWGYAQLMIEWLTKQNKKFNLHYMDLRNQSFTYNADMITVCDLLNAGNGHILTLEVAHCSTPSMVMFFGCCGNARAQRDTAIIREQKHRNALRVPQLEPGHQPPAINGLPSNTIEMQRGCSRDARNRTE